MAKAPPKKLPLKKAPVKKAPPPPAPAQQVGKPAPPPPPAPAQVKKGKKDQPVRRASSLLAASMAAAREEYKDPMIVAAGELQGTMIGIPIPLVLQYLLQLSHLPLQFLMHVNGEEGSNKSAFGFEFVRLFREAQGVGYLIENESKYNPMWSQSIIGWEDEIGEETMGVFPSSAQEEWQQRLQFARTTVAKQMLIKSGDNPNPTGLIYPIFFQLDSLAGKLAEESNEKIEKEGHAGRSHPIEALNNKRFLQKFVGDLVGYPFFFMIINHLKKQKAEQGQHLERIRGGGKFLLFAESFEIELAREKVVRHVDDREEAVSTDIVSNIIKIQCRKNSFGETFRQITCDLRWWYDRAATTGKARQYTRWQWEESLVELLETIRKAGGVRRERLESILDMHEAKEVYWSKRLGIAKDKGVTKHEFGDAIQKNTEVVDQLRDFFAIARINEFVPGDPKNSFSKQLEVLRAAAQKRLHRG